MENGHLIFKQVSVGKLLPSTHPLIFTQRDDTGIGGSWSEFLEYLVNSIKFGDVKLVLEGQSKSDGN